ncbi:SDR family oxidoreductase [Shinella sp. CPCC 100929]|uniref:SDR family oxidoreductase n=1 Tax=Shinella lacus TaxID=2654216 RepID=A0ABT1R0P1_9HYPH|nr:SDR family oxidoreductase [Shinella lacus]MCQ4628747.1 SDR family oxidoreductase [Shinella lacus]
MDKTQQTRTALVFGGSRGIGGAIAKRLAADGFQVALTYVSRPEKAAVVVSTIEAMGGKALAIRADSADPAEIRAGVNRTVAEYGPLDVAVVNAGVLKLGLLDDFPIKDLDLSLNVNIRGVYLAIQAAARQMRDGGRIITIGSNIGSRTASSAGTVYAMTKAAVAAMSQGIALDLAPRRITVNNIQPGPTETDLTADMISVLKDQIPLKRVGQPEEIAALASYLVSAEAGYMTGASLTIDGGYIL